VTLLVQDFWSQVIGGAAEGEGLRIAFEHFGKAEVGQANVAIFIHKNVFGFQITVNNLFVVQMADS